MFLCWIFEYSNNWITFLIQSNSWSSHNLQLRTQIVSKFDFPEKNINSFKMKVEFNILLVCWKESHMVAWPLKISSYLYHVYFKILKETFHFFTLSIIFRVNLNPKRPLIALTVFSISNEVTFLQDFRAFLEHSLHNNQKTVGIFSKSPTTHECVIRR